MRESHPAGRTIALLGLFGALAALHTWPLAYAPSREIHAAEDVLPGMWSLTEMAGRLVTDPAHLMDGNIFYPFRNTLAILDHQFSSALLAAPLSAGGVDGVYIYNVVLLSTFVLSGWFTCLLVRRLTGSTGAGLVAGSLFAFSGYRALHLTQAHLLATQWLPLSLLALHRYVERPTWPRWTGFAAATLLLALASWHVAIIGAIGVGLVAVWMLAGDLGRARRPAAGLVLAALLCALALLPLARAYMRIGAQWPPLTGQGRETVGNLVNMSANLAGLIAPAATSLAPYRPWLSPFDQSHPGVFPGVMALLLSLPALVALGRAKAPPSGASQLLRAGLAGATALVLVAIGAALAGPSGEPVVSVLRPLAPVVLFGLTLAGVGLVAARRAGPVDGQTRQVLAYTVVAIAGALLALGPRVLVGPVDIGSGLWRFDLLPVTLVIRAPERLSLLLALGTSVLAGFGVARLVKGRGTLTSAAVVAVLLVVVNADLRFTSPALQPVPGLRQADRWLAQQPEAGAVIDYPLHWTNMWAMYSSQRYGRRVVNGTGYLIPWQYKSLEDQPDLSPDQMAVLWEHFHPRFAVVRTDLYEPEEKARVFADLEGQPGALLERARFGSDYVFEIVDQGHGAEIFRRWPYGELAGMAELALEARVTAGRSDTVGELVVSLNDRVILAAPNADAAEASSYAVPFSPGDLVDGLNAFQISAGYRFRETAEAHPIGTTGVELAADVVVTADRERAVVTVNGRVFRPGRGYFLVVIDPPTGRIVRTGGFDVSWSAAEADAMATFVGGVPAGAVVLVATEFDASRELSEAAVAALADLGLEADLRGQFQAMHAAIGVKGAAAGTAIEGTDRVHVTLTLGDMDRREVQLTSLTLR